MISKKRANRDARRIRRSVATVAKTSIKSAALAMAAGQVVARRSALGVAALRNPLRNDHQELGRIVPEKINALNSAALGIALQTGELARRIVRHSGTEAVMFSRGMGALARCRTPASVAALQGELATAWFFRSMSHAIALNEVCMRTWAGVVAPMHQVVMNNARRLS